MCHQSIYRQVGKGMTQMYSGERLEAKLAPANEEAK